jgi:hypothetical protein
MKSRAEKARDTIPDVCYEIATLLEASDCYDQAKLKRDWSSQSPAEKQAASNLCNFALESFLLHYRNLEEFFQNMGGYDCVNAKDYALWLYKRSTKKSPTPNHHPKLAPEDEIKRIHKRLAHISNERSDMDSNWPISQMNERICAGFEEFVIAVPATERHKFNDATEAIKKRRAQVAQQFLSSWQNSTASPQVIGTPYPLNYLKIIK